MNNAYIFEIMFEFNSFKKAMSIVNHHTSESMNCDLHSASSTREKIYYSKMKCSGNSVPRSLLLRSTINTALKLNGQYNQFRLHIATFMRLFPVVQGMICRPLLPHSGKLAKNDAFYICMSNEISIYY